MQCDQCEMITLDGVPLHKIECPNRPQTHGRNTERRCNVALTRKHFRELARILAENRCEMSRSSHDCICEDIAQWCRSENSGFDKAQFFAAAEKKKDTEE